MRPIAKVTIVIPVKDRLDDLKMTVESVRFQTVLPAELIIVDDFSGVPITTDDFEEIEGVNLRILRNVPNLGAAASCNLGVREASHPTVLFLDSDDCFAASYVEEVTNAWSLAADTTVCIAAGFWWCTNELQPYKEQIVTQNVSREALLERGNFVGGNSVLSVRRESYLVAGGFPDVRGAYDWGLLLRMSRLGDIVPIQKALLFYRSPSTSLLPNDTRNFRRQNLALYAIVKEQPLNDRRKARRVLLRAICFRNGARNGFSSAFARV